MSATPRKTTESPSGRVLRLHHVQVQAVLVWDDGELSPGPSLEPMQLSLSRLREFTDNLPALIEQVAEGVRADEDSAESLSNCR